MSFAGFRAATGYRGVDADFVTKSDSASSYNVRGKRFIQVTGVAGDVVFRQVGGITSKPVPLALNQSFELGSDMENIQSTGTTATNIITFY